MVSLLEFQFLSGTCSAVCHEAVELQNLMAEGPHGLMQHPACHTRQALVTAAAVMTKHSMAKSYVVP